MRLALQKSSLIDYPGRLACVLFLPGCNLRCPFCHNPSLVDPDPADPGLIDLKDAYAYLERRKGVLEAVVFSGGEACLHPELLEMIRFAAALGYKVKLDTNGLLPEKIPLCELDFVAMDLKTLPERYRLIPGAPEDSEKRIGRSIGLIRESGVEHEFRTTLAPGFAGLEEAVSLARMLGQGESYALQRYRPGRTLDPGYSPLPLDEAFYEAVLSAVKQITPGVRLR
jgi:pyruvate formate lyase activating enzyme